MKLSGLTVLDLSVFLPGPYMTQALSDHGATVIKIENKDEGDPGRRIGEAYGVGSVFFHNVNRGKKSVALDLKTAAGVEAFLGLAETADVVVESFRPGVVDRLGVGYDAVLARNPAIVYCSISAFGQSGPYRQKPAHDLVLQALSGAQSLTLGSDGAPAMSGVATADVISSLQALSGVLMALFRAKSTGQGDFVDISMHEAMLAAAPNVLGPVFTEDRQPPVGETRTTGGGAFYRIYETRDGRHVVLGGQEHKFAETLLTWLGRPDLLAACKLPPGPGQRPAIDFLKQTFLTRTMEEWVTALADLDVCFGPVKTLPEAFDDPHARARRVVLTDGEGRRHLAPVVRFREEPSSIRFDVPRHGEHTIEILGDVLARKANS